jgi:hypothetical protein
MKCDLGETVNTWKHHRLKSRVPTGVRCDKWYESEILERMDNCEAFVLVPAT